MIYAVALVIVIAFFAVRALRKGRATEGPDTSAGLETWVADALESELASEVLGIRVPTAAEKKPLARTLRGEPDVGVVSAIEAAVKSVQIEFLRYAHENDAEVTLRVTYEDGRAGSASTRLAWLALPPSVRRDFEAKGTTRVFRSWAFPWSRT